MTAPILRAATANDSDALAALLTELGHPARATDIPARLSALSRDCGAAIVAVDDNDNPLGLICLARITSIHSTGPIAYITTLITASAAHAFYPACGLPYTGRRFAIDLDAAKPPE